MKVSAIIVAIRSKKLYEKQFYLGKMINILWILFVLFLIIMVYTESSNIILQIGVGLSPVLGLVLHFIERSLKNQKKYFDEIGELILNDIEGITIALHNKGVKVYQFYEIENLEIKISNYVQEEYEGKASIFNNGIDNHISFVYQNKIYKYCFLIEDIDTFQKFIDIRNSLTLTIYKDLI